MKNDYKTIGELLEDLSGHGVYDVAITGEFEQFGFTYDRATDLLSYGGLSERLFARTAEQIRASMDRDPKGGVIDGDVKIDTLMTDAVSISSAIHKLLLPGKPVPSDNYHGRGRQYRVDVASIRAVENALKASNPLN